VKQFARCTNCRQWYTDSFTTMVEIFTGRHVPKTTIWCRRCIAEAEHRSQYPTIQPDGVAVSYISEPSTGALIMTEPVVSSNFQQLVSAHTTLMERAIHEDEAILVPLIEKFMQRCRSAQVHLEQPEHIQRLTDHLQYWEAFLKALHQSP
jgi:hypothetical protein